MLKRIGFVAMLAACSSREDITTVTGIEARGSALPGDPAPGAAPAGSAGNSPSNSPGNAVGGGVAGDAAGSSGLVWATPARASSPPGVAPADATPERIERVAREQLEGQASEHGYSAARVAELNLTELHDTGDGTIIARFDRRVGGIGVFGQQVSVAMDRNLTALAFSGNTSGELPLVDKATGAGGFTLPPERAVIMAVADVTGVELAVAELAAATRDDSEYERFALAPSALARFGAPASTVPARTRQTLFPASNKQLLPAYYVETNVGADADGRPRYHAHVISAVDGGVLWKRDLTADEAFTYRVYADPSGLFTPWDGPQGTALSPHPTGQPDEGLALAFEAAELVTLSSLTALGVDDPWLPDGATETRGNNVDAYLDLEAPDGLTEDDDFRGQVSAPGVFDAVFDPLSDADRDETQQTAAVTQLFYDINWFHDWYYAAGFTEAAGNAQTRNFGRGGLGGDAIVAEAQDNGGKNNANMSTPADGESPRMQMYLWDFGPSSLTVTGPEAVAGTYETGAASFSPLRFDLTGPIVRADPADGCAPLVGDYTGAIVLFDRGGEDCGPFAFTAKAANAEQAGAIAAVVANVPTSDAPENPPEPSGDPSVPITIGVLTLNLADGDRLRAALEQESELLGTASRDAILRDGDLDNQIVAHEWGHYISNRLVGNAAGLGTNMGGGLGEGWGDFHALLLTVRAEDATAPANANFSGLYAIGGYASAALSSDGYYFGTRRYPYSTDLTKDPLTFRHISNDAPLPEGIPNSGDFDHTEVHAVGEVWATMLWECYAALLRDTLGAAPRLSFDEARDRMRDYLVASYKLTPNNPTLLEARDALLAAALARDEADLQRFSAAFARRGAGVFAVAPNRFDPSNRGVVESYATGAALVPTSATLLDDVAPECTPDGILDSGEVGTLRVTFRNIGNNPSPAAVATVVTSVVGVELPDGAALPVPALPILGSAEVDVRVALAGLTDITPVDFTVQAPDTGAGVPPAKLYAFATNADELQNRSFDDSAESSHVVWSVLASEDVPAAGRWGRNEVSVGAHVYHGPGTAVAGTADFQSPPLQVERGVAFSVTFAHRFSFETDGENFYDGGVIELSSDGGETWVDVGESLGYGGTLFSEGGSPLGGRAAFVAESPGYPEFASATLQLGRRYGGQTVLLRFRIASDAGTASTGWDLDDIRVSGVSEPPFDAVVPQAQSCSAPVAPAPVSLE